MVIASHMSDRSKAALGLPRSPFGLSALLPALVLLLAIPATARGDIFKWTDEQGRINISNVPPPEAVKAKDVELVLKEPRLTPSEQALLARIQSLERQVQEQKYAAQPPAVPPPTPYPSYSPPAPQPPPPSPGYYDSGYDAGYDNSYYPDYYPSYYPVYSYPLVRSYLYAGYPARTHVIRPAFTPSQGGSSHSGGGHSGGGVRGGSGHSGGGGGHSGSGHGGHR